MWVELSIPEMQIIRNLIIEKHVGNPLSLFDSHSDLEQCKALLMLKLFAALEDASDVPHLIN
jgi:hypothetical protein